MNIKKYLFPSLLVCAGLALIHRMSTKATSAKPVSKGTSYDAIDAYIEEQRRRLHIPGAALAIVEGDQIVHARGFGRARPGGETPTPQTPFFIGSLTKSITALAVMQRMRHIILLFIFSQHAACPHIYMLRCLNVHMLIYILLFCLICKLSYPHLPYFLFHPIVPTDHYLLSLSKD